MLARYDIIGGNRQRTKTRGTLLRLAWGCHRRNTKLNEENIQEKPDKRKCDRKHKHGL